ncbi:MAG TPA: GNAT family N-acetyltransferase [Nitrospira sp.]|nr:GNAT family N-acetyltransferase [Nitrospira sp.]
MSLPNQLTIRAANLDDVGSIITFSAAMARETENRRLDEARLREGTLSLLNTPSYGFFVVAELRDGDQRKLIGQLMITYEWSDWRNGVFWWIQSVYVDPAWRRQGVFRRMHDVIVGRAKEDPRACGIRLYVEQDNRTAQTVYERVGLSPSAYAVYEQDFVLARASRAKDSF